MEITNMRYFLDCEFIESGPNNPIYLISIGIVAEDGRELYLQNAELLRTKNINIDKWILENIFPQIGAEIDIPLGSETKHIAALINHPMFEYWKFNGEIKELIIEFIGNDPNIEFYGYYSAYDWVVFCQIFGTMMDLPKGKRISTTTIKAGNYEAGDTFDLNNQILGKFPMYCNDLKQLCNMLGNPILPKLKDLVYCETHNLILDNTLISKHRKFGGECILKKLNEHHALNDARWNKYIYNYLKTYNQGNCM
jgi:hypothetical protein